MSVLRGKRVKALSSYHHFKTSSLGSADRVARCERYVVDLILACELGESERDETATWELKHTSACAQLARMLAAGRGLPEDICVTALLLHDISVATTGAYRSHAGLSSEMVPGILTEVGGYGDDEISQIASMIAVHSDKSTFTSDPMLEFAKDVDSFESLLYPGAVEHFLLSKPFLDVKNELERGISVFGELSLPVPKRLLVLDTYSDPWFVHHSSLVLDGSPESLLPALVTAVAARPALSPFLITFWAPTPEIWAPTVDSKNELVELLGDLTHEEIRPPEESGLGDSGGLSCLVLWPALNAYEGLSDEGAAERLTQFGVPVPRGKGGLK